MPTMYVYRRRRRTNPWRVFLLLLLIGGMLYLLVRVQKHQQEAMAPSPTLPPTPTRSATSYRQEGEDLYWEGRLREAIAAYQQAVVLEPGDISLYPPLVRLLVLDGRVQEAIRYGERAAAMAPNSAPVWAALCMAYDWVGWVQDAVEACERAISLDPALPEAYAFAAEAYMDAGRWNEALQAAQQARKLDPRSVDAHRAYGYVLEMMGNYSGAIEAYRQALEVHPKLAYLYLDIGRNAQALARPSDAIAAFKKAVELAPYRADALAQLGWAYYAIEEYQEARAYLEKAVQADPEYATAYGRLATVYWTQRNYESAIPNFEKAIEMAYRAARRNARAFYITTEPVRETYISPSPATKVLEGRLRWADPQGNHLTAELLPTDPMGRWAGARGRLSLDPRTGDYTLTLEGMPDPPVGQVYVGWFSGLRTLADTPLNTGPLWVAADGTLTVTLKAEPVRGPRIEYYYTLGLCYYYLAQCERAYPLFDAALQIDPEDVNAKEGIRLCRQAEGTQTP